MKPFKQFQLEACRAYFGRLLEEHGGNVKQAAIASGVNRTDLHKKIIRYGLRKKNAKPQFDPEYFYPDGTPIT